MRLPAVQEEWILETAKQNANTIVIVFAGAPRGHEFVDRRGRRRRVGGVSGRARGACSRQYPDGKSQPFRPADREFSVQSGRLSRRRRLSRRDENSIQRGTARGLSLVRRRTGERKLTADAFPFRNTDSSYSKFEYSALAIEKAGEGVEVSFDIANVSQRAGAETAQIYVREVHSKVFRPFKELKGFEKIYLEAGEKKRLRITLDKNAFAFYSSALDKWTVNRGVFEIFVAANAEDIRLKGSVEIE